MARPFGAKVGILSDVLRVLSGMKLTLQGFAGPWFRVSSLIRAL